MINKIATILTLLLASAAPAYAAPQCDALRYCSGSESRMWESAYAAAFVLFTIQGYDDNAAAGLAEARADAAVRIYKQRHAK